MSIDYLGRLHAGEGQWENWNVLRHASATAGTGTRIVVMLTGENGEGRPKLQVRVSARPQESLAHQERLRWADPTTRKKHSTTRFAEKRPRLADGAPNLVLSHAERYREIVFGWWSSP